MKNEKLISMEEIYFEKKYSEARRKFEEKDFEAVKEILKEPLLKLNAKEKKTYPKNIFEKIMLTEFYNLKLNEEDFSDSNYNNFYLMMGSIECYLGNYKEARKYYQKMIDYNPASVIARLQMLKIDIKEKNFDNFIPTLNDIFKKIYNKSDMARAYRYFGYYLYEIKDYEMAVVAYLLSNLYEVSEIALDEIAFINRTQNVTVTNVEGYNTLLKKLCEKYNIDASYNVDIVKLAERVGKEAEENNSLKTALACYQVAYDLTFNSKFLMSLYALKQSI